MLNRKRSNRRREDRPDRWLVFKQHWRQLAIGCGAALAVGVLTFGVRKLLDQPIEQITVQGSFQRISAMEVEKVARAQVQGTGLVSVDLAAVRRALGSLSWIDQVTVQRSWPRGLRIAVTEQVAVARWNQSGLVNARGEQFLSDARFVPPELPQLFGPPGTEAEVVTRYVAAQGRMVEAGLRLIALRLDARGAWELTLDNGIGVRLGRRQVEERFERFMAVALRQVSQRTTDIAYVDMRYTNGFAVGWRTGATRLASIGNAEGLSPDG
jgi:cell division protein FtsQ